MTINLIIITANLPTNIEEFRGFDSSIILICRGGIIMSIGDFPESFSRAMSVWVMLAGRLGILLSLLVVLLVVVLFPGPRPAPSRSA